MVKKQYKEVLQTWLCPGCGTPKTLARIDAHIQEDYPPNGPLNFIGFTGISVVRKDFLEMLGPGVDRDLLIGRLFGPEGSLIKDWVTCIGKERVIIRGSKHVSHRLCDQCGRNVYFAMGKPYLYPEPPGNVEIFQSDLYGLIVRGKVLQRIDVSLLSNVTELPVAKEPKDSLGILPWIDQTKRQNGS